MAPVLFVNNQNLDADSSRTMSVAFVPRLPRLTACGAPLQEFMVQITHRQATIGSVLQEGNHFLRDGCLTPEEERQIDAQIALLNSSWEELRLKAMDRQTK